MTRYRVVLDKKKEKLCTVLYGLNPLTNENKDKQQFKQEYQYLIHKASSKLPVLPDFQITHESLINIHSTPQYTVRWKI